MNVVYRVLLAIVVPLVFEVYQATQVSMVFLVKLVYKVKRVNEVAQLRHSSVMSVFLAIAVEQEPLDERVRQVLLVPQAFEVPQVTLVALDQTVHQATVADLAIVVTMVMMAYRAWRE